MRIAVPSLVTLCGLALGLAGVVLWPHAAAAIALLAASVALDLVDGALARGLDAVTGWGRELDFACDCAIAHAVVWVGWPAELRPVAVAGLVVVQACSRSVGQQRISGRSFAVGLALLLRFAAGGG